MSRPHFFPSGLIYFDKKTAIDNFIKLETLKISECEGVSIKPKKPTDSKTKKSSKEDDDEDKDEEAELEEREEGEDDDDDDDHLQLEDIENDDSISGI